MQATQSHYKFGQNILGALVIKLQTLPNVISKIICLPRCIYKITNLYWDQLEWLEHASGLLIYDITTGHNLQTLITIGTSHHIK